MTTLVPLLVLSILLTGCSTIVLHPIDKADIARIKVGESYKTDRDGWFISDMYLEKVIQAKVK